MTIGKSAWAATVALVSVVILGFASYRAGGGNNLRLRTRIFGLLSPGWGLPMRGLPQKGCSSSAKSAIAQGRGEIT